MKKKIQNVGVSYFQSSSSSSSSQRMPPEVALWPLCRMVQKEPIPLAPWREKNGGIWDQQPPASTFRCFADRSRELPIWQVHVCAVGIATVPQNGTFVAFSKDDVLWWMMWNCNVGNVKTVSSERQTVRCAASVCTSLDTFIATGQGCVTFLKGQLPLLVPFYGYTPVCSRSLLIA